MGQELIAQLRRKNAPREDGIKQELATIDYICGRGEVQDILINGLDWDDNQEFIISENNIEKLRSTCSDLCKERDRVENELKNLINCIKEKTLLGMNAANKEIAKESLEDADYYFNEGLTEFWDAFYLINGLVNMCSTSLTLYQELTKNGEDKTDLEICFIWSY